MSNYPEWVKAELNALVELARVPGCNKWAVTVRLAQLGARYPISKKIVLSINLMLRADPRARATFDNIVIQQLTPRKPRNQARAMGARIAYQKRISAKGNK